MKLKVILFPLLGLIPVMPAILWLVAFYSAPTDTDMTYWPSVDRYGGKGFIAYGASETGVGFLVICDWPEDQATLKRKVGYFLGIRRETIQVRRMAGGDLNLELGGKPGLLIINQDNAAIHGTIDISRRELQDLVNRIEATRKKTASWKVNAVELALEFVHRYWNRTELSGPVRSR